MSKESSATVLVSSAGRRVELLGCFREAARRLGIRGRILAADVKPEWSAACQVADAWFQVPRCLDDGFVETMLRICREEGVRLLIPTIDTELAVLARHRGDFAAVGTVVAISDPEVVQMARDKEETVRFLSAAAIPVPRTARAESLRAAPDGWRWPVIIKPIGGSASQGLQILNAPDEVRRLELLEGAYLAQEMGQGREFTVNAFFDASGRLRCAIPHWRVEVRAGEVSKGVTERVAVLGEIAGRLGDRLRGARGALCFQAMVDEGGEAVVFEINARFGGGYPLADAAGARFAQWLIEEVTGRPSSAGDAWEEGLAMLRYDAAVFQRQRGEG